ncbi:MAG: CDP-alcohol phosphatidyltransferase family protein [Actinomycetota bacterium]|nr:CDP-alcohol phosphatidyltransferase family protein [Actinomycetota bacterium]
MAQYTYGPTAIATPANVITAIRVALTPVIAFNYYDHGPSLFVFVLWTLVSVTDKADGWLARRQGATKSGAFLDPLADKILVFGAFAAIVFRGDTWWLPIAAMALREIWMSLYRTKLAKIGVSVPARPLGKAKTFVQMIAIGIIFMPSVGQVRLPIGELFIYAALALSYVSLYYYLVDGHNKVAALPKGE